MQIPRVEPDVGPDAHRQVSELFQTHALGLVRLAVFMVGDQQTAEDVVQDAFLGLYRNWSRLQDTANPVGYIRASVLNGCRLVHRKNSRRDRATLVLMEKAEDAASAESAVILDAANREVLDALRRISRRQREAVVLRYYLEMSEEEAAQAMHVSRGTVKSATSRGLKALARMLKEEAA
jgi:RNA polymerase sigma-70 factor (sigma-E family)